MVVDGGAKVVDREVRREGVREAEALELAVGERDRRLEPLGDRVEPHGAQPVERRLDRAETAREKRHHRHLRLVRRRRRRRRR